MLISRGPVCSSMPVSHTYSFSVVETERKLSVIYGKLFKFAR
jgi:hypothetical protein